MGYEVLRQLLLTQELAISQPIAVLQFFKATEWLDTEYLLSMELFRQLVQRLVLGLLISEAKADDKREEKKSFLA